MARRSGWSTGLLLGVVLVLTSGAALAGDGWWGRLDEGEAVSLADVIANPPAYRGKTLTFFCLFHSRENYFDPVRTPFTPARYDNVSVWPDGAPIWEEQAFRRDLPFLYVPRDHPERDALLRLEMVTRIEVTGKIRAVLRGRPFIEVFGFRPTGHRVGREVVRAVNYGDNYARLGTAEGDQLAASRYRDALTPDLPPVYDLVVRKRLADALRRLGNQTQADLVERGEILGAGGMPAPQPAMPFEGPGTPADGPFARAGSVADEPPGAGDPLASPPSPYPFPEPGPSPALPSPSAPRPFTEDLPGQPSGPLTPLDDLPGTPVQGSLRAPVPPPPALPGGRGAPLPPPALPPATPATTPSAWPQREPPLEGVPPKRRPRLSGVK